MLDALKLQKLAICMTIFNKISNLTNYVGLRNNNVDRIGF